MALFTSKSKTENEELGSAVQNEKNTKSQKKVIELYPPCSLAEFSGHPFKVRDDEEMKSLVDSIKEIGIVSPLLVRRMPSGACEIISGHRRKHAAEIIGLDYVPCQVLDISHDEAIPMMVASNLETRKTILPSEKAFAYKMQLDALKRQGKRTDLTSTPLVSKSGELRTNEQLGEEVGESREQIRRYIRLTNLCKGLLALVDEDKLKLRPAVELSYLQFESQAMVVKAIEMFDRIPTTIEAIKMRNSDEQCEFSFDFIKELFAEKQQNDCQIILRLSKEQLQKLNEDVGKTTFSREEYLRRVLSGYELKAVPPDFGELVHEYRKIGANLNQLLKIYYTKGMLNVPDVEDTLADLKKLYGKAYERFT